jgi:hypothetical protein
MATKFFEREGMKSAGGASAADLRQGFSDEDIVEPDPHSFEVFIEQREERENFGGFLGPRDGNER